MYDGSEDADDLKNPMCRPINIQIQVAVISSQTFQNLTRGQTEDACLSLTSRIFSPSEYTVAFSQKEEVFTFVKITVFSRLNKLLWEVERPHL